MYYLQKKNDWLTVMGQNTPTFKRYPWKICQQSDFGDSEESKKYFAAWGGFDLICPNMPEGETFFVEGEPASVLSNVF